MFIHTRFHFNITLLVLVLLLWEHLEMCVGKDGAQEVGLDWGGDVPLLRGQNPLGTE